MLETSCRSMLGKIRNYSVVAFVSVIENALSVKANPSLNLVNLSLKEHALYTFC